jgi:hypothetical protein
VKLGDIHHVLRGKECRVALRAGIPAARAGGNSLKLTTENELAWGRISDMLGVAQAGSEADFRSETALIRSCGRNGKTRIEQHAIYEQAQNRHHHQERPHAA